MKSNDGGLNCLQVASLQHVFTDLGSVRETIPALIRLIVVEAYKVSIYNRSALLIRTNCFYISLCLVLAIYSSIS